MRWRKTEESGKATFICGPNSACGPKGKPRATFSTWSSITPDCDNDTLLALVKPNRSDLPQGHHRAASASRATSGCFLYQPGATAGRAQAWRIRKAPTPAKPCTPAVTKRIAQKVGAEGVETALAATVHDQF